MYVFMFWWACGRALHTYIFLTSGWSLMGHALHTAPSGSGCMRLGPSVRSARVSITPPFPELCNTPGRSFPPLLPLLCLSPGSPVPICTRGSHHKSLSYHFSIASSVPFACSFSSCHIMWLCWYNIARGSILYSH